MNKPILEIKDVSMRFVLGSEKIESFKEYIIKTIKRNVKYNVHYALKNVSFEIQKGDRVAVLGLNGAGKSTLLKVIAGVYKPTKGTVVKRGKIIPLLELGAGFERQYTGRENIFLYGAFLGYSKEFIESKLDEIIKFSELGKFIDMPIMNYSSGMRARLGFSIATVVQPEILILDEVLSVGDVSFKQKSEQKIRSLMKDDVTVLFVSHNINQVKKICNKAIIIDKGTLVAQGDVEEVCNIYQKMVDAGRQSTYELVTNNLDAPELTVTLDVKGKPIINWKPIEGAAKYQVIRSETAEEYKQLTVVTDTTVVNFRALPETKYYYKVRAIASDGTFGRFSEVASITTAPEITKSNIQIIDPNFNLVTNNLEAPELTLLLDDKGKPVLNWKPVEGAAKYHVIRSENGQDYMQLTLVADTTVVNFRALPETKYYYKVRAIAFDGTFGRFSEVASVTTASDKSKIDSSTQKID